MIPFPQITREACPLAYIKPSLQDFYNKASGYSCLGKMDYHLNKILASCTLLLLLIFMSLYL